MQAKLIEAVQRQLSANSRKKKKKKKKRHRPPDTKQDVRDLQEMRESLMFEDNINGTGPVWQPQVSKTWPAGSEHKLVHATHHYVKSKEVAMENSAQKHDRWFEITKEFIHNVSSCTFEIARVILIISRSLDTKIVPTGILMARSRTTLKPKNFGRVMRVPMGKRFFFIEDDLGFKVFGHHNYMELPEGYDVNDVIVGTRLTYFMIMPDFPEKSHNDMDEVEAECEHEGKPGTIWRDQVVIFPKAVQIRVVKWWTPHLRTGKLKPKDLVEKKIFIPFKKTEEDLLREERLKIKQKRLEKRRAKKISKIRKKGKKPKKKREIEMSSHEVDNTLSLTVSSNVLTVTETFSEVPAPAKNNGFHIPSF